MQDSLAKYSYSPEQIGAMAKKLVESRLFPGIKTEAQAFTLMMLADADGVHPMKVGFRYDILPSGKPSMKGEAMLAEFMARGGTVDWVRLDNDVCEAVFYSPGVPKGVTIRWTMADAQAARLAAKDNWKMYPRQMLKWRVVTDGVKTTLPAAGQGLYPTEVAQDFDEPKTVPADAEIVHGPQDVLAAGDDGEGVATTGVENTPAAVPPPEAPPQTDADVPFEQLLQDSIEQARIKAGRPKSVPRFCPCGAPVVKLEASSGGIYWRCHWADAERSKMKEQGIPAEKIREDENLKAHYFHWSGGAK